MLIFINIRQNDDQQIHCPLRKKLHIALVRSVFQFSPTAKKVEYKAKKTNYYSQIK